MSENDASLQHVSSERNVFRTGVVYWCRKEVNAFLDWGKRRELAVLDGFHIKNISSRVVRMNLSNSSAVCNFVSLAVFILRALWTKLENDEKPDATTAGCQ